MKQARFLLTSIALLLCSITISAHDFEVDGIYYNITSSTDNTVEVTHKGTTYGGYAKSVTIPTRVTYNGKTYEVTSIGYEAFYRCSRLTSIEIPNSVTSIGEYAFEDCYSLTSIEIPNSVTSIGNYAFYGCSNLKNVINNSSLNITKGSSSFGYIAYYADRVLSGDYVDGFIFDGEDGDYILTYYLGNETNLVLPDNYMEQSYRIGDYAFYGCSSLTSIDLPDGLTSIGYAAFYKCSSLTSIDLPDGLTSIGDWAFGSCSSLTSIEIPNSVTSIGDYAFYGCTNLKNVTIGDNINTIGRWAFSGCSNLDYFSFGKSVKSIGQEAFSDCVNLKKLISYAEVPPTCDTNALDDINKWECTLQIPENTLSAYQSANQWKDFFFIEDVLSEIGGVNIDESKDTRVDVYSINGQLIKRNADAKQLSKELPTGIYIINGKKVYVR